MKRRNTNKPDCSRTLFSATPLARFSNGSHTYPKRCAGIYGIQAGFLSHPRRRLHGPSQGHPPLAIAVFLSFGFTNRDQSNNANQNKDRVIRTFPWLATDILACRLWKTMGIKMMAVVEIWSVRRKRGI